MPKYCKICGAEWEENFDECPNCGMPENPDEQLWFDKDARQRLKKKKHITQKKPVRRITKLNRGIFLPLIIGAGGVFRMIAGGITVHTIMWDVISIFMFVVSVGYIIKAKFFR